MKKQIVDQHLKMMPLTILMMSLNSLESKCNVDDYYGNQKVSFNSCGKLIVKLLVDNENQ